jgi:murein DD-endopeptidase MepM/ murein hydrolase activator NlpD
MYKYLLATVGGLIVLVFGIFLLSGKRVDLKMARPANAIGSATTLSVEADAEHGTKTFSAAVEQNGQAQTVYEDKTRSPQPARIYTFTAGQRQAPFLKEGPAKLILKASSNDLRGRTTTLTEDIQVVLRPPTVVPDGRQHYINQGGSELVTMDLGGSWTEAGVRAGNYSAGSFPMPGEPDNSNHRFSPFPFPWDLSPDTVPFVFARNVANTEVTATFWVKVFPKRFRESSIQLTDKNMQKVVGELDPDGTGSLVERFVRLNREMRRSNAQTIYNLRTNTEKKILWSGAFIPVKGTRESFFADKRSYFYNGRKVDEQVHLGYDLAQTSNTPVKAANSGKVIYADRLGLYGNCVIIDHGYSLQSLYGHMSKILVKVGDNVGKEQQIGISGATGMAFGDHVHFSMMVAGTQVDPKEWWDEHWINDRILSKIGPGASRAPADANSAATHSSSATESTASLRRRHKRR